MRRPASLVVRIGGVAAAAAIAVTGATTVASASIAPVAATAVAHRIPTRLAISTTRPADRPHQATAIINGHLTAGRFDLRHLRVWLERLGPKGKWHVMQLKLTRPYGHVFFRVHVGARPANFRLVFPGTPNLDRSVSRVDTIASARS